MDGTIDGVNRLIRLINEGPKIINSIKFKALKILPVRLRFFRFFEICERQLAGWLCSAFNSPDSEAIQLRLSLPSTTNILATISHGHTQLHERITCSTLKLTTSIIID
jgi:hypothetical protein